MSSTPRTVVNVAELPSYVFRSRSIMWWGTLGVMVIEGTAFAMTLAAYFYLRSASDTWPPGLEPPALLWGTLNTLVMLISILPNQWTKHRAEAHDLGGVRVGMVACLAVAAVFLLFRIFEFRTLNCSWDSNAYGSIVWLLMGLHTVHLLTDFVDSTVLAVLMFTGPLEGRRYADVAENAVYWDFVVLAWLPIYAVVYWAPRFG